jgi:hypothetical protein
MDISKGYIKMCEKAVEIQEFIEKPTTGKYVYDGKFCVDENDRLWLADDKVCLLRQDELQEMCKLPNLSYFYKFKNYVMNHIANLPDDAEEIESFEQLKLKFLMKFKFNKVWDGEDWV